MARALADGRYRRIVLTGMGSSYFALHPLHLRLVEDRRLSEEAGHLSWWRPRSCSTTSGASSRRTRCSCSSPSRAAAPRSCGSWPRRAGACTRSPSDEILLLAFASEARTRELTAALVRDARAAGDRAHLVSEDAEHAVFRLPTLPPVARAVLELLPVEIVTLALAALDGREAGRFRVAGKVTTRE